MGSFATKARRRSSRGFALSCADGDADVCDGSKRRRPGGRSIVEPEARRNESSWTSISRPICRIQGDRVQLQQVMLNLMMNAIESMVGEKRGYRELHVASEKDDAQVMLTVRDTGHGFDPDARDRIFEAFFTTKAHGMGMGLAISRSIVETHGGRLWATESEIRGSAFRFTIPTA